MKLRAIITTYIFLIFVNTPAMANVNSISASKQIVPNGVENICQESEVQIMVKGGEETTVRKKVDVVLLMDHSYSMFEYNDGRMEESKNAAISFINELDPLNDNLGLVRFSSVAEKQHSLTDNYGPIKSKINAYHHDSFSSFTNISDAIDKGVDEIKINGRAEATKLLILFSDGGVNRPEKNGVENKVYARQKAFESAQDATTEGIIIYTVVLGNSNIDKDLLESIADVSGGKFFVAPNPADITNAYLEIASDVTSSIASNIKIFDSINSNFILVPGSVYPPAMINTNPDNSKTLEWHVGVLKSNQDLLFRYKLQGINSGDNQQTRINDQTTAIEYLDANGNKSEKNLEDTYISIKSSSCGSGGNNDNDDEDKDEDDDDRDNDDSKETTSSTDEQNDKGSVLGASNTMNHLPITGAFSELLQSKDNINKAILVIGFASIAITLILVTILKFRDR